MIADLLPSGAAHDIAVATLLAWGVIEAVLRLRLMLRPGLRTKLRDWPAVIGARAREWTFAVIVAGLLAAVSMAIWALRLRWAEIGGAGSGVEWGMVIAGEALLVAGIVLRVWSILTLDRFFTFVVGISDGHRVIKNGPYRMVRHPGYAGALLALLGFGVALANWLALALMLVVPPVVLAVRIRVEEAALTASLGNEYQDYARRTASVIPRVW